MTCCGWSLLSLLWLWADEARGFETQSTWVANNATGCLDDQYYFDVFFVNLGAGTCRIDEFDTSGNGYDTAWRAFNIPTLEECLDICFDLSYCTGAEYRASDGRCEIWNQTVGYMRSSSAMRCIAKQEVTCSFFQGKNCTAEVYDRNVTSKLERLHSSCPDACSEVRPSCPADFVFRTARLGGLYLTAAGELEVEKDQYAAGYNLIFNVKGQGSASAGFLEMTALSADGSLQVVAERAKYLISRVQAKLLLGPWGDETFEAVAQVADTDGAVLMGPLSHVNDSVAERPTVFSLARSYEEVLLGPFQAIHQRGVATVSYIGPSAARAAAHRLEANYRTCEKLAQTAQEAQLVFLRGEELDDVEEEQWSSHVAAAVERLLTPRPEVIVCCESSVVCAADILNATYQSAYDAKAFIMLDDKDLAIPLNRATIDFFNHNRMANDVEMWLQQRMMEMGQVQSLDEVRQWMALSYLSMNAFDYSAWWSVERQEMMKDCLVVSAWDRNSVAAAGFMFLQHYQVRTHAQQFSAAAWSGTEALLEAIRLSNDTSPQVVAEQLMRLEIDSVLGRVTFDQQGRRQQPSSMVQLNVAPEQIRMQGGFPGMVRFDVRYNEPLKYPKPSWKESYCFQMNLGPPDGSAYGFMLNNDTGMEECAVCSEGETSRWDHRQRRRICERCLPGTEISQGVCRPCQAGRYSELPGSAQCLRCAAGTFQSREGQTDCQPCAAGSFSSQTGMSSCTPCTDTFDTSDPDTRVRWSFEGSVACQTCMEGATCEADANGAYANFTNADGYYLFPLELVYSNFTEMYPLYRCNHGRGLACLKGGHCYVDPETGVEAMMGPMCGACRPGYAKAIGQPLGLCRQCRSRTMNVLGVTLQLLTVCGMAGFLMVVNFLTDYSKPKNILSIILKQLFNYLQMASAVLSTGGAHGLYGGLSVLSFFETTQDYLGFSSAAWVPEAGACLIQELLPGWGVNKVLTTVGLAWFPFTALFSMLIFMLINLVRRLLRLSSLDVRHLKTWFLVNFFLCIPRVNRLLLANFKCQTYDTSRLMMDTNIVCWGIDHAMWQAVSWVGIAFFSVGGPLVLYLILRRLAKQQLLGNWKVSNTYGFLFAGFEPDFYYFECVYMFRKLCFEFVLTVPGMTSEDEEILGRINSSSVAFVASIFFALHMACQPYDNRDYFILDRIETASLNAVLVTAFLQLWCLNTNEADGIVHNEWLYDLRNTICTAVIAFLHLRFFWLFFYGIARRRIQRCVSTCRGRDFSHGIVKFVPDGMQLHNLSGSEEELLKTLMSEILDLHMQTKRKIAFDQWSGSLQMLCLEARRQHIESEILAMDRVGNLLRSWRDISRKLFHGSRLGLTCERMLARLETAYGLVSNSGSYANSKKQKDKELEDLKIFCAESLNRILNKEFRVDELQDSMLSLGRSICDNKRIVGLGETMKAQDEVMHETMSHALEFYVGPMDMDENVAMALKERSSIKEAEELRKEVAERQRECAELRRQIHHLRVKGKELVAEGNEDGDDVEHWEARRDEVEELQVELVKSSKALNEVTEERDGAKAEVERLREEVDKQEDYNEEAKVVIEEQQTKIHALEEKLQRSHSQFRLSCWSCHSKVSDDAVYCPQCGKALQAEL